ncbi:pleiotropic drug resistance protein 3-like [Rhododendron vialii]|uniref:pleiotropic drug resistance protein 3-like n=1 Tax=Rhododendron vialii TaxID=182163 RepID=UPI0026601253|nr:pleiotropic drug resistance protein 3-like [Rhododendron vialii]
MEQITDDIEIMEVGEMGSGSERSSLLQQHLASSFQTNSATASDGRSSPASDKSTATSEGRSSTSTIFKEGRSSTSTIFNGKWWFSEHGRGDHEFEYAAIKTLPPTVQLRTSLSYRAYLSSAKDNKGKNIAVVDIKELRDAERHLFVDNLLKKIEDDNHRLLRKVSQRLNRVGLDFPTVEVRFKNLRVKAEYLPHEESTPTLWNVLKRIFSVCTLNCRANNTKILQDVQGILKPSRMTLLLGPPGCGKTTLLKAIGGKLDQSLKVTGDISYNGYKLNEFLPQKTSAYISQYDVHISEMTVRETLDFSACCQGIGSGSEIMMEIIRREKEAGIIPDPVLDTYMKATAIEGLNKTLRTDYILKILGLGNSADTIVGDAMTTGISGGQKRRLTTGEMIIGPIKVLLMDEISNGLDSSTTFQIVTCLQQWTHATRSTTLLSLLQPAHEIFDLFDDLILMAEGKIAYQGPRDNVIEFFEHCGFRCPPRKGIADFLQEVVSRKDQEQYWYHTNQAYNYISVKDFRNEFKKFHVGRKLDKELSQDFIRSDFYKNALSFNVYSLRKWELFKACMAREWLLMRRNSFVHVVKSAQLVVIALITMTMFYTRVNINLIQANYFMASLFYALMRLMTNGITELSMTISRLAVFHKQRDMYFYPAWAYTIPTAILKIPFSFVDAFLWTALTYYVIGYSPEPERFFRQLMILFLLHQVSISWFRLVASVFPNPSVATSFALFSLVAMSCFGGFIIPQPSLPTWLKWGFWVSPLAYAEVGASINEFLAPRWQKASPSNATIGNEVLMVHGLNYSDFFYWISVGALIGFWLIFNIGFTFSLSYSKPPGKSRTIISHKKSLEEQLHFASANASAKEKKKGVVLSFEPMTITFNNVQYFINAPKKTGEHESKTERVQLLKDVTGTFRDGVLTALMGASGAGKTTLMDVLSGRKTGGIIEGDIRIGGYPKVQDTYSRISGYCEQSDIHSPQVTIHESLTYSAWLRLPPDIDQNTKSEFVAEVLHMMELDGIKDALVGFPGVSGISNEQRKRLTIAVELVSNPSILFMDEPTTGLDARAAAIIMRVVKNIVNTRRTVVCTIHQPSIDIFEAFDEIILMKRGGQIIYSGELGKHSNKLIEYFEAIPGVPKIRENYNPATWMLEVTSPSAEAQLGLNFARVYDKSSPCRNTKELVRILSIPAKGSAELSFSTSFPQNGWEQFKACLWKQNLSYWRSPKYNIVRLVFITMVSLCLGAVFWQKGREINSEQDLFNIAGAIFIFLQFLGIGNCSSVISFIATERPVMYRERFAGMYSSWAYSFAQVTIEIPYVFFQALLFVLITYPTIGFYWSISKVLWYMYVMFCTMLYFTYIGMLLVASTPKVQLASILASFCYTMTNLFAGFLVPGPNIPKWWVWFYWICPMSWSLEGILTSQYGDIEREISAFGEQKALNAFLESYYGYHHHHLGVAALVLFAFPLVFATCFAYAIAKLNFQRR